MYAQIKSLQKLCGGLSATILRPTTHRHLRNLIAISNDQVRLLHSSLREFLTQSNEQWSVEKDPEILGFRVDLDNTHRLLASACIRYLGLGDYGLPWQDASCLPIKRAQNPFLEYSFKNGLFHITKSGLPCPILVNAISDFLKSRRCVSWVEHCFLDMADDLAFVTVLSDFDEFGDWLFGSYRAEGILGEMMAMLGQEMEKRLQISNPNDPSTERWALFMRFAQDHMPITPDTEVSQTQNQTMEEPRIPSQTVATGPSRLAPPNVEALTRQTMRLVNRDIASSLGSSLRLHFQMDIVLIIRNISSTAQVLTDSLELLFQLILRKSNSVPVHALLFIASFYKRVEHYDKAILVTQTALDKIQGTDTELEFDLLGELGRRYVDRGNYDQGIAFFEREVTGRARRYGEIDTAMIEVKIRLGRALYNCPQPRRIREAEVVFLQLRDHDSRSPSMTNLQLLNILRFVGLCRRYFGDPMQAITVFMGALDLHVTVDALICDMESKIKYDIGRTWHCLKKYDHAMIWYEKALEQHGFEDTPSSDTRSRTTYYRARTLYSLQKWDECLNSLRLSLPDLQALPTVVEVSWKEDALKLLYKLGRKYFSLGSFACALNCFQLAHDEWIGTSGSKLSAYEVTKCTFFCAASSYGLGDVAQGLEFLRGITKVPENFDGLIE